MNKLDGLANGGIGSGSTDKQYRSLTSDAYTFGYDDKAESKTRLIVKERNIEQLREYELEDGINYICCGCFTKNKSKNYAYFNEDGVLMVPERHVCEVISLEASNQDQKRKRGLFIEAMKLKNKVKNLRTNVLPAQASPALPTPMGSSKDIPFVDLTLTDSLENVGDVEVVEGVGHNEETKKKTTERATTRSRTLGPSLNRSHASSHSNRRRARTPFTMPSSSGMSLSNVAPVKPGSSLSPPIKKRRTTQTEMKKRFDDEQQKNLTINNLATRNMMFEQTPGNALPQASTSNSSGEFREVDETGYHYGFNELGELQKRLIVYEQNRAFVREYALKGKDNWRCVNCSIGYARKDDCNFFVAVRHDCLPFSISESKERQSRYRDIYESIRDNRPSASSLNGNSSIVANDQNKSLSAILPPSYHKVQPSNWQYGFDSKGNPEKRIIVRDADNLEHGHEYRNDRYDTRCLGCTKSGKVAAKLIDGDLYVPPLGEHTCEPRIYAEIQKFQQEYKNMGRKRGRTVEVSRNVVKKDTKIRREEDKVEDSHMNNSNTVEPQSIVADNLTVSSVQNVSRFSSSNPSSAAKVSFYPPSAFFLSKCCKEFNIKYSNEAYKFWSHIFIERVQLSSRPSKVYEIKDTMYHGFSSFSLFFTGNESNTVIIPEMINRYVYKNFKSLGHFMGHDFSQYNHETPIIREALWSFALTDIHLECISRWFKCRIGIFSDNKWKRYGKWDEEESGIPTFLIEIKNGKHNPILALA